nr:hypothetical protein CFP56_38970 [Quercus suber]
MRITSKDALSCQDDIAARPEPAVSAASLSFPAVAVLSVLHGTAASNGKRGYLMFALRRSFFGCLPGQRRGTHDGCHSFEPGDKYLARLTCEGQVDWSGRTLRCASPLRTVHSCKSRFRSTIIPPGAVRSRLTSDADSKVKISTSTMIHILFKGASSRTYEEFPR